MYCTVDNVKKILPEAVTIGDQNLGTPTPGSSITKRSNLTPDEARQYIQFAQQDIDSQLRPYYSCPLRRIVQFETPIENMITAGTNVSVLVHDTGSFGVGMKVRLKDTMKWEEATVKSVTSDTAMVIETVANNYDDGLVSIIGYPDPIPLITARLACSYIIDRLFTSEQSPDVSNYGKSQRELVRNDVYNVLAGQSLLFGQEHTGRRFVRGSLINAFSNPATEIARSNDTE